MTVGSQARSVTWFEEVLNQRDRNLAAETAPPEGLYLVAVTYPDEFSLPAVPEGPMLLEGQL